jgi:hypothetical protein
VPGPLCWWPLIKIHIKKNGNFKAPDLIRISFWGDIDINGTYKNCRKIISGSEFKVKIVRRTTEWTRP